MEPKLSKWKSNKDRSKYNLKKDLSGTEKDKEEFPSMKNHFYEKSSPN